MPPIKRLSPGRRNWNDLHRSQLRDGADHSGQRFGVENIGARRRGIEPGPFADDEAYWRAYRLAGTDFDPATMAAAEHAWADLADELLAEDGHETFWGFRRFEAPAANGN